MRRRRTQTQCLQRMLMGDENRGMRSLEVAETKYGELRRELLEVSYRPCFKGDKIRTCRDAQEGEHDRIK